jgi:hypothetical protein
VPEGRFASQGDIPEAGFDLIRASGAPSAMTVLAFSGEYFADACDPEAGVATTEATADAFMAFLTDRDGIVVDEPPKPVTVAGYDGLVVDLHTELPEPCASNEPPWTWLWTMPVFGDFHFIDDERARVIALDVEGQVLVIVIESYPDANHDDFLEDALSIVESMEIEATR